ncbi:MAG TPA: DUF6029 family protein [Candidatus Kapabacteria bacterium]|nr:DUF6029 family protein [Candidatus Kapabacteria bacterium]
MTNRLLNLVWKAALLGLLVLAFPLVSFAQTNNDVSATGSNLLRYGTGSTTDALGNPVDKQYFEEIADARIFFQNFQLGLRYEMDDPSEVGRSFQGPQFRRRWLAYRKDDVDIQAGDVSALFGRGLAINLFESRPLNYDSWLDGVFGKGEYKIPKDITDLDASIAVQAVGGRENFYPVPPSTSSNFSQADTLPMEISARSANAEFGFFKKKLLLGATFLQASTSTTQAALHGNETTSRDINEPDFYADLNSGQFEAFVEWTEDRTHVDQFLNILNTGLVDTNHTGHAVYGSLSYANSIIGLTFDYKNYSYFLHAPGDPYTNVFSKLPISSPPEVYKDFTFTEITRTTHAVNFDDEVGYQLEANITAIPQFVIDLDAAASSSHDKYNTAGLAVDRTSILPKLSDQGFYPFWEAYAEAEWDFDPATEENFVKVAIHRRSDVIAYNASSPSATDYRWATTIAGKVQYETTPNQSFLGILEHQWAYDGSLGTTDKRRMNELLTLQYSFDPTINFGAIFDYAFFYASGPIVVDKATFGGWNLHLWGNAELGHLPEFFVGLRLGQSHSMLVSYGAERGGLNCTGGICRVVPPFSGLRLTVTSQI